MTARNEILQDERFRQVLETETKRRGLQISATCKYCGERLTSQDVSVILSHSRACKGPKISRYYGIRGLKSNIQSRVL